MRAESKEENCESHPAMHSQPEEVEEYRLGVSQTLTTRFLEQVS